MYCIVPLAGPDFYNKDYGIKPNYEIDGEKLIKVAITGRSWYKDGELVNEDLIFVLRDEEIYQEFEIYLKNEFKGCKIVKINNFTKGALMTSLAGVSLIKKFNVPVVIDLIDMIYEANFSPNKLFEENRMLEGIIPYFKSNNPKYSYLEIVGEYVKQSTEKKVISDNASVGTYFFKDIKVFLHSVCESLKYNKLVEYNENLFLCPSYNFMKLDVLALEVEKVKELSTIFHNSDRIY